MIIVGSGPAGWSAAIYTARANLRPLLITGNELGGQIALTTEVENFPGFEQIQGPELVERMQKQAERFGTEVLIDYVTEIDVNGPPFTVTHRVGPRVQDQGHHRGDGRVAPPLGRAGRGPADRPRRQLLRHLRRLLLPQQGRGRGGGGDSALQEGLFLTKFASKVRIIHRRDQLRAGAVLQRRAKENPKIEFVWNTRRRERQRRGEGRKPHAAQSGDRRGHGVTRPTASSCTSATCRTTQLFVDKLAMDEDGYLITDKLMRTSVPGIFAAGEIQDHRFKQAATSAGQGVAAAMEVEKYLADLEDRTYPGREETYKEVEMAA